MKSIAVTFSEVAMSSRGDNPRFDSTTEVGERVNEQLDVILVVLL